MLTILSAYGILGQMVRNNWYRPYSSMVIMKMKTKYLYYFLDGTNVKLALRGHSAWVSSVSWSSTSEYTLCSGSYDSTVRIWDIRSKGPLYTIEAEDSTKKEKVFGVHWDGERVLSGGEDKKLRLYQAKV
ncbi:WD40-repeat-containing domain protein [Phycomyces nitens]|nr:WD40-repeat-containing domain protein [Phycomyces nitens]